MQKVDKVDDVLTIVDPTDKKTSTFRTFPNGAVYFSVKDESGAVHYGAGMNLDKKSADALIKHLTNR